MTIDGKRFSDRHFDQHMKLNTAEEWTVQNEATNINHPFHIHINPFQVIAVFEPNAPEAQPGGPCEVKPDDPNTFKPCPLRQPKIAPGPPWWIWWDTFPIPTGKQVKLTSCTKKSDCPANIRDFVRCTDAQGTTPGVCTEYIPGWFKMRSRFMDFTGQYVQHCHILIHEDRGMMQLIEVYADQPTPDTLAPLHH
jgi:hypothetical protein